MRFFEWHASDGPKCPVCYPKKKFSDSTMIPSEDYSGMFGSGANHARMSLYYVAIGIVLLVGFLVSIFSN